MGQVICDIERNEREIIRVEVSEFKGKHLINMRIWYYHMDGEYRPTQKGFALDISRFDQLKDAVDKLSNFVEDFNKGEVEIPSEVDVQE